MDFKQLIKDNDFDVNTNDIQMNYWLQNKELINKSKEFIDNVMIPYCEENNHYVSPKLKSYEDSTKETKNWNFGLYKTNYDNMKAFCHTTSTHTDLYIVIKHNIHLNSNSTPEDIEKYEFFNRFDLICVRLSSEFSDDEYRYARGEAIENILKHIDNTKSRLYYGTMIWNTHSVKRDESKVTIKEVLNTRPEFGMLKDGWQRMLFNLSCDKHYLKD
jgi:hypothetical protein